MRRKGKPMTSKLDPTLKKQTSPKKKAPRYQEPLQDKEKFLSIEQKIQRLRQKREKLHLNQALFFTKEVQKILEDEFSLEMALVILEKTWATASKSQKEEWSKHVPSFRAAFNSAYEKEPHPDNSAPQQI